MIKEEFVKEVSNRSGVKQVDVSKALETGIDVITEQLKDGGYVLFAGFGRFERVHRFPKRIENFKRKEVYTEETYVPIFRPGKNFKEDIAGSYKHG